MNQTFEAIFKKLQNGSDVRGSAIATETEPLNLTPQIASEIALSFRDFLAEKTGKDIRELRIGVGHDSRLTAEAMKEGVLAGLDACEGFDCGLVSTPAMFLSTVLAESSFDGAVMITASHLPFNRNGLKFFTKEGGLEKADITKILQGAAEIRDKGLTPKGGAASKTFDLVSLYSRHMMDIIKKEVNADDYDKPLTGLRIAVDAGNGAAGFFASRILVPLGADIEGSRYLEPDGHFPNHVPNPENKDAMAAIRSAVLESHADLGVIFDCDGDRGACVFADGTEVNRNALIALMAAILAPAHPDAVVVTDSVTSDELAVFLEKELGLTHLRFKRGYKNVINKGIELTKEGRDCPLAIETSGHGALAENYFSDDGAYLSVKIICEMARLRKDGRRIEELIAKLGYPAEEKEIRLSISGDNFAEYGQRMLEDFKAFAEKEACFCLVSPNYEGVRLRYDDGEKKGWILVRLSLHDPVIPINAEANAAGGVDAILAKVRPFFTGYDRLSSF
ncbi:MAG: phosphomannomutase/phosphoglucomutase [Lachnospiraceae bacterium]|nr:phosphomannomutase/phosphoglucomutase [Lachnospiraceae bacterium]